MAKPDYVSELKWFSTTQAASGKGPVAKGSLQVGNQLFINFAVWENEGGLQIAFPRTENPKFDSSQPASKDNKRYFDEVGPVSSEARTDLFGYILADLEKNRGGASSASSGSSSSGSSSRGKARNDDAIPF